ncbi:MAG: hypothetical protein Q8K75_08125 [Chlamydiales bacterium]|nr:hypothetical protein [Chlamydiales bacterium]
MLNDEEIENNLKLVREVPQLLVADARGVLYSSKADKGGGISLINQLLLRHNRYLANALLLTLQAATKDTNIEQLREDLHTKDVIIDTLQAQVDTLIEQKVPAIPTESLPPPPVMPIVEVPPPTPDFVVEEERALLTSSTAQELRKVDRLLAQLEKGEGESTEPLPPPLSLAREIGLASTGRTPRPSEEENLLNIRKLYDRIKSLHEIWEEQLKASREGEPMPPSKPKGTGWLELDEAEVKELEKTLGTVQTRNEHLREENERLKARIADLEKNG